MRKIVIATGMLLSVAAEAAAQDTQPNMTPLQQIEESRRQERREIDRQYEATRRSRELPSASSKADPWASVRGAEAAPKKVEKKPVSRTARKPEAKPPPAR